MSKDKFKKRKRLIRGELLRRDIRVQEIAAGLGYTVQAIYKGMTSSPKVMAALIAAGVPERLFKCLGPRIEASKDAKATG